jgi:hypothetical protein
MYWVVRTTLYSSLRSDAKLLPRGDAASQDALNCAAVELFEDLRAHAKSFQPLGRDTMVELWHEFESWV